MKSLRLYLIVLGSILIIYLVAQYNRPKPVSWDTTLNINDKIPFGTYVLYNRINDIFPGAKVETFREPVYNVVNDHGIDHATYLIISNSVNLNEYDYAKLKKFIGSGNDVFIAAAYFGDELRKQLNIQTRSEFTNKNFMRIRFTNKYLDTARLYYTDKSTGNGYFDKVDTAKCTVLGMNSNNEANYVRYHIGQGNLYLNTNPLLFSNYSLLDAEGMEYAQKALSVIKNDPKLIWDEYYTSGRSDDDSSMRIFLRNPVLKWAFYIAFFSLLFFVLYEIKRRQRIIPVIEPLANSTLDFVNVVGQVYYEKRDNANIARKKGIYLLAHLRDKYHLKTTLLDGEFIEKLSQKTGVDTLLAKNLANAINFVNAHERITDDELIKLNYLIEQFYTQSR